MLTISWGEPEQALREVAIAICNCITKAECCSLLFCIHELAFQLVLIKQHACKNVLPVLDSVM